DEPEREIAGDRADDRVGERDEGGPDVEDEPRPEQEQGEIVGQQARFLIDEGERDRAPAEERRADGRGAGAETPGPVGGAQARQQLHERILEADRRAAPRAAAPQHEVAQDGDVLQRADAAPARRAARARNEQVIGLRGGERLAGELGALGAPFALQHLRQAMDDDVEERARAQAENERHPWKDRRLEQPARAERRQTAPPSLKIGRYIATTMPPISVPSTTMMSGSMSEESASTASSTSAS